MAQKLDLPEKIVGLLAACVVACLCLAFLMPFIIGLGFPSELNDDYVRRHFASLPLMYVLIILAVSTYALLIWLPVWLLADKFIGPLGYTSLMLIGGILGLVAGVVFLSFDDAPYPTLFEQYPDAGIMCVLSGSIIGCISGFVALFSARLFALFDAK